LMSTGRRSPSSPNSSIIVLFSVIRMHLLKIDFAKTIVYFIIQNMSGENGFG
jgi:hypothetical protein